MQKLRRNFKRLSVKDKVKFVLFLPLACLAIVLDSFVDTLAYIIRWVFNFFKWNWKEMTVLLVTVAIVAAPIMGVIHVTQTVHRFRGDDMSDAQRYVYQNCHEMANNFIVAEDGNIRGFVRADDDNIDRIVSVIVEYNLDDKDALIDWLMSFKEGDYSDAVNFHNYCWEELGGEIGFAVELRSKYR